MLVCNIIWCMTIWNKVINLVNFIFHNIHRAWYKKMSLEKKRKPLALLWAVYFKAWLLQTTSLNTLHGKGSEIFKSIFNNYLKYMPLPLHYTCSFLDYGFIFSPPLVMGWIQIQVLAYSFYYCIHIQKDQGLLIRDPGNFNVGSALPRLFVIQTSLKRMTDLP